jgi:parafibromin
MKDHNGSSSCLVGCRSQTIEGPTQPERLDPEIISYFLVPGTSNHQDSETVSAPQQDGGTQDNETVSTFRQKRVGRHFRHRSSEKSPKSPNSAKSGDSRRSKISKRRSIDSSLSASSRYPRITDWSAGVSATSPSSFGPPQRNSVDPPRPPKPGYEWVWFPEGYWAEREIRGFIPPSHATKQKWWNRSVSQNSQIIQKSQSIPKAANEDNVNDNKIPSSFIPQIKIGSVSLKSITLASRRTSRHTSGDSQRSSNLWRFNFSKPGNQEATESAQQREGLYCRTKRNIEARFRKIVRAWPSRHGTADTQSL